MMARRTKRTHKITLIPGDGIGPEVSGAVVKILEAAGAATGVAFDWHGMTRGRMRLRRRASTFRRRCMTRSRRIGWR